MADWFSRDDAEALCQRILGFSTADECRVNLNSGVQGNTRFAVNQISTSGDTFNGAVTIQATVGTRSASVTTNVFDDDTLRDAVQNAERLARLAPENPEHVPVLGQQDYMQVDRFFESTADLTPERRVSAAETAIGPADAADCQAAGFIIRSVGAQAVATSAGLFAYDVGTSSTYTLTVRTNDATGSGWAGTAHADWGQTTPASTLAERAVQKALASRNAVAVEPGRYTVVLEPTAVGHLLLRMRGAFNARSADEGRSFFSKRGGGNKLGEQVVDDRVTILSDPADPDLLTGAFTNEGLPIGRTAWIEDGVVQNLSYSRYWAERQGQPVRPFGGGFKMLGGEASLDELIGGVERGILVTRFWYIRPVDPRTILYTGLTRDGTFLIEDGQITQAVKNLRFNESPIFMLNNLVGMGRSVRVSSSESGGLGTAVVVPPLVCRDFSFTSLSDAV